MPDIRWPDRAALSCPRLQYPRFKIYFFQFFMSMCNFGCRLTFSSFVTMINSRPPQSLWHRIGQAPGTSRKRVNQVVCKRTNCPGRHVDTWVDRVLTGSSQISYKGHQKISSNFPVKKKFPYRSHEPSKLVFLFRQSQLHSESTVSRPLAPCAVCNRKGDRLRFGRILGSHCGPK
jgi:hypothetical protein